MRLRRFGNEEQSIVFDIDDVVYAWVNHIRGIQVDLLFENAKGIHLDSWSYDNDEVVRQVASWIETREWEELDTTGGWPSVKHGLPKASTLVLTKVLESDIPHLAIYTGKVWKVQPLFGKWFVCESGGVTHWKPIA